MRLLSELNICKQLFANHAVIDNDVISDYIDIQKICKCSKQVAFVVDKTKYGQIHQVIYSKWIVQGSTIGINKMIMVQIM